VFSQGRIPEAIVTEKPIRVCTGWEQASSRLNAQIDARVFGGVGTCPGLKIDGGGLKRLNDVIEHESITKAALTSPLRALYKQHIRIFILTTHTLPSQEHTQSTRCTEHTACARLARLRRRRFRTRPLRRPRRRADVSLARPTLVRHATNVCALRVFSTVSSTLAGCSILTCHRRHR
jgi:hypothetical protein